jgi:hypothetical protein
VAGGACGNATKTAPRPPPKEEPTAPPPTTTPTPSVSPVVCVPPKYKNTAGSCVECTAPTKRVNGECIEPKILTCTAEQSSAYPCAENEITICFTTNVPFDKYTIQEDIDLGQGPVIKDTTFYKTLEVSGLRDTCNHGPDTTQDLDVSSDIIALLKGAWTADQGTLLVKVDGAVSKGSEMCFSIPLVNPRCSQDGSDVRLKITSEAVSEASRALALEAGGGAYDATFTEITCDSSSADPATETCEQFPNNGGRRPLRVLAPKMVSTIQGSTPYPCENSIISVTLEFNMPLLCPCATAGSTESNQLITLSGLTGSLSDDIDGDLQQAPFLLTSTLDSGDQTNNLDSVGKWTRATGELVIDLGAVGPSYTPCSTLAFTFTLLNSNAAKPAANVFASIPALPFTCTGCGEQCSAPQALTLMPGGEKPLLVRTGSIRATMCQTSPWPGADNTITVTLTPNINLFGKGTKGNALCESELVISGLDRACNEADGGLGCFEPGALVLAGNDAGKFKNPKDETASQGYLQYS